MTLGEFNCCIAGRMDLLKYQTAIEARSAVGIIKGVREKKPRVKQLFKEMMGETRAPMSDAMAKLLAQSNARVRRSASGNV